MPYHKDKQQAFQAAQQGYAQVTDAKNNLVKTSSNYGSELKHLQKEVGEAVMQIENALEVASEHQREQLEQFQQDLSAIQKEIIE
ncbi:hypothetical protein [Pseudalkalibacillus caeni]|uniref:Small, acid-soluble spore protein N n=1 Tax=Exobacillus caeni TaxID=2574798 RepID=A0A5R9F4W8_9BACL|nr:hypothetical protein [Pseudalkalibacillus caeni]TLS37440.1 hypothetical protein FCL54_09850 [Pseudalkalibacillus caeni]